MVLFKSSMAVWKLLWQKLVKHTDCNKVLLESQNPTSTWNTCDLFCACVQTNKKKSPGESKSVLKSTQSSRLIQHRPRDWVTWALIPTECLTVCKSWNLFVPHFQWVEWNSWVLAWLCPSLLCWEDFQECFEAGAWQVVLLCSEPKLMLPEPTKIWSFLLSM